MEREEATKDETITTKELKEEKEDLLVDLYDEPEDMNTQTVIQNRYCFWCHRRGGKTSNNYEDCMKQIANFQTVEHFWRIYNHLQRPNDFKTTTDYHLFKNGIKPTWEDSQNERGGKWMVRLKKGLTSRYWEELILAIIGEQFDVGHEICGAVVSIRHNEDIISVWNKNADNTEAKNKIRDQMRRILKLPAFIPIEYKKHQDSIVDKSSFRNTVVWRSTPGEGSGRNYHNNNNNSNNNNSGNNNNDEKDSGRKDRGGSERPAFGSRQNNNSGPNSNSSSSWKSNRTNTNDSRSPRDPSSSSSSSSSKFPSSSSSGSWTKNSSSKSPWRKTETVGDGHSSHSKDTETSKEGDRSSDSQADNE